METYRLGNLKIDGRLLYIHVMLREQWTFMRIRIFGKAIMLTAISFPLDHQ